MNKDSKYNWKKSERKVKIPSYGWVKLKEKNYLLSEDHIRSCVLKKEANKFYVSFLIESDEKVKIPIESKIKEVKITDNSNSLGIDLGLKTYATSLDGRTFNFPKKKVNKLNKKIKKVSKKLSRKFLKNKNKLNWRKKNVEKVKLKMRILFEKKKRVVLGFIQNTVNDLVKTKHLNFVIENLKISNMIKNKNLSRSIQENNFYVFKQKLINKCNKVCKNLYLADSFYPSSKTCSKCLTKQEIKLSQRIFKCENCGLELDRDFNASVNLSYIGGYAENLSLV